MNSNDLDQIITELDEFIEDLKSERKTIDPKEGRVEYTKKSLFGNEEHAGTLSDNLAHSILMYKEYKNSEHPLRAHYILECYEWMTKAMTAGVVISNSLMKELEKCKEKCMELEKRTNDAELKIEALKEEKAELKAQLSIYKRDVPDSDIGISDVTND